MIGRVSPRKNIHFRHVFSQVSAAAGDIDAVLVNRLKASDPDRPIREADMTRIGCHFPKYEPKGDIGSDDPRPLDR